MDHRHNHGRLGDIGAMLRAVSTATPAQNDSIARKRALVADLCRLLGRQMQDAVPARSRRSGLSPLPALSPRLKQTLAMLLEGASEKQIARQLSLSQHTIHVYVKALYKGFGVSSRGELLARFIGNSPDLLQKPLQ